MASSKICFECGVRKPLRLFYKHRKMADGRLGKCKACTKTYVRNNYQKTWTAKAAYERQRWKDPERRRRALDYMREYRIKNPGRYRARTAVSNALRDGRLVRQPCKVCGSTERVQAHHDDYRKPLEITWLCFRHHREGEHNQRTE